MKRFKHWRRALSDPLVYLLVRSFAASVGWCPAGGRRLFSRAVGAALWNTPGRRGRRILEANLHLAFPELSEAERYRLARLALFGMVRDAVEFTYLLQHPSHIKKRVTLDPALMALRQTENHPSTLVVVPHLGNWELFGHATSINGIRGTAVAQELRNPYLERMVQRIRSTHGLQIIHVKGAARGIVRAVRQGRHVAILMDQNTRIREGGEYVDFFGLPVTVSRAPAVLARRLDTGILISTCIREGDDYVTDTEPLPKSPAEYADEHELLQAIMSKVEVLVRRHPEHYIWTYKRWRYIPSGIAEEKQQRYPFYARAEDE